MYHWMWLFIMQSMSINIFANIDGPTNNSAFKDMYVIKAITYQVGILTNDSQRNNNATGEQVAITFYSKNGSDIDLNKLPPSMLTNVTGEGIIAVAPIKELNNSSSQPWNYFDDIIYGNTTAYDKNDIIHNSADTTKSRNPQHIVARSNKPINEPNNYGRSEEDKVYKRSVENQSDIIINSTEPIVKFFRESAIIPQNASINALYLPPLLNLQSNLSVLPVPIPNTGIIHYTKIDTLVKSTQTKKI